MNIYIEDVGHPRINGFPCACPDCVNGRITVNAKLAEIPDCERDHCSPEERAVIEAAVGFERAHLAAEWAFEGKPYTISDGHLRRTVKQLLATRSKEESK